VVSKVRVGSVGLGLGLVGLVLGLGLELGLGIWFGLGECPGREMPSWKFPALSRLQNSFSFASAAHSIAASDELTSLSSVFLPSVPRLFFVECIFFKSSRTMFTLGITSTSACLPSGCLASPSPFISFNHVR